LSISYTRSKLGMIAIGYFDKVWKVNIGKISTKVCHT